MFTPAYPAVLGLSRNLAAAYANVGIETAVGGASPHKLIELLFNGFMDAVAQARGAMRARQIEAKGKAITRATRIIDEGLRECLNLREGGPLARDLASLYEYVAVRLMAANLKNNEAALDECVRLIGPLREAWIAIGPQVEGSK